MAYAIGFVIVGLLVFLLLQPKVKALVAFVFMMQFFDAGPSIAFGYYVWDYGAILMLMAGLDVYLRKVVVPPQRHLYLVLFKLFMAWLLICFFWSLLVYQYPLMHTIKSARYMIVGYFMILIFIRLFAVQPDSFEFLMRWCYRITLVLMPLVLLQFLLQRQILFSLFRDYEGVLRAVPVFLPICLLNFWILFAKYLSAERLAAHEYAYMLLAVAVVALSFTRGIYAAFVIMSIVLIWTLSRQRQLKAASLFGVAAAGLLFIAALLATGLAGKVAGRAATGLALIGSGGATADTLKKDDTFNGRLGLMAERFSLVLEHNPIVGFGFIHEDDVPAEIRYRLRFGTALSGTAEDPDAYTKSYVFSDAYVLGFYSADIAWADIVISTGLVGVLLLVAAVAAFVIEYLSSSDVVHPMGGAVRTGIFLEFMMLFMLTIDGSYFFSNEHLLAFLLAGYSLTRTNVANARVSALVPRFKNFV
jgi:O-Antigen ligase